MSDEPDKNLMTARPPPGAEGSDVYSASTVASQAPADLLELVRDAEEAAKVGAGETPTSATKFHAAEAASNDAKSPTQEVVDVDDDAIDAPPSLPPMRARTPIDAMTVAKAEAIDEEEAAPASKAVRRRAEPRATATPAASAESESRGLPPAVAIVLIFAFAVAAVALVAR